MSDEPRKRSFACGCLAFLVIVVLLVVFWPVILGGLIFALATLQVLLERLAG